MTQEVTLTKGTSVELSKAAGITKVTAGLGWDITEGASNYDLDLFMVAIGGDKMAVDGGLVYYGNKALAAGGAHVDEDNLTGEGDGYDEQGHIDFTALPATVEGVVIGVSIYDAANRGQTFEQVDGAFADVLDNSGAEPVKLASYDLSLAMDDNTGVVVGQFSRDGDDWKFTAIGKPAAGGMPEIIAKYGINA